METASNPRVHEPAQLRHESLLAGLSLLRVAPPVAAGSGALSVHEGVVTRYVKDAYADFHTLTLHLDGAVLHRRRRGARGEAESSFPGAVSLQPCDAEGVWHSEESCRWLHFYLPVSLVTHAAEAHFGVDGARVELATITGRYDPHIVPLLFRAAVMLSAGRAIDDSELAGWSEAIALRWLEQYSNLAAITPRGREVLPVFKLRRAQALMEEQLSEPLRIADIARELGLSTAHFARGFHHTAGESPHRYLLRRRAARARELLADPGRALADIALDTGFANQAHFSATFRRLYGIPPGVYRRRLSSRAWSDAQAPRH